MARPLNRGNEHPLMPGACSRDPLRNNPSLLRDEALKFLFGLVVNKIFFVIAEAARAFFPYLS